MTEVIGRLQRELEMIYGLSLPFRAQDFLLREGEVPRPAQVEGAPEALLIRQDPDGLSIGLHLDRHLLERLARHDRDDPRPTVITHSLGAFTSVLEGVSHFVYLAFRAARDEPVSLLDLETQAEVDKFVTSLLHLWRRRQKAESPRLRSRLFDRVRYRASLAPAGEDRYRTANDLARHYCRRLETRFLSEGSPEGLLREVRRSYRLGGAQKRAHLRRVAA